MRFRRLESCFCCGLSTGATSIAIVYLVFNVLGIVLFSLAICYENVLRHEIASDPSLFDGRQPTAEEVEVALANTKTLLLNSITVLALSTPFDVLLLAAARLRRHRWLLGWLAWYGVLTALSIVWGLYLLVMFAKDGERSPDVWMYVVLHLGATGVGCYLVAVVVSFYLQLREQRSRSQEGYDLQPLQEA